MEGIVFEMKVFDFLKSVTVNEKTTYFLFQVKYATKKPDASGRVALKLVAWLLLRPAAVAKPTGDRGRIPSQLVAFSFRAINYFENFDQF